EEDADGGVPPEQRDGDAEEGDVRVGLNRGEVDPELPAEDVHRACQACERTGDRHRREVAAGDADAPVPRRLRVEADRPYLVAERGAVEQDRVDDERRERDEEADVESLEP